MKTLMQAYPIQTLPKKDWPPMLLEIPEPPVTVTYRGTLPDFSDRNHKFLSVVGSRKCTTYGKQVCEELVYGLKGYPITIISGMALGIDSIAHETALKAGLHCMVVPGSGLEDRVLYPSSNRSLAKRILEAGGCLFSEFPTDFVATLWGFPRRNRIMVGLSHAVLLVEATEKSGTLITARLTAEYNRDLLAVPGSIFSHTSKGVHQFLKLGATPVTCVDDILQSLGLENTRKKPATQSLLTSIQEEEVLDALTEPLTRDALAHRVSLSFIEFSTVLSNLELEGVLQIKGGVVHKK
jgi:DNA processing protein